MLRELLTINPRNPVSNPRRKAKKAHKARRHRNPRFFGGSGALAGITKPLVPALIGGGGALVIDVLLAKLPLPEDLKAKISSGPMRTLARAGAAFLLGYGAGFVIKRETANQLMAGAFTVIAYDEIKGLLNAQFPQLLSAYRYEGDLAAYDRVSNYNALPTVRALSASGESGMSAYRRDDVLNGLQPVVR